MTQDEFNAWIAAQGGPQAVQYATENRTIPNPDLPSASDPIGRATADPNIPKTITIQVQTWVNPKTGAKLTLKPSATAGQFDVVEQVGAKPPTATDPGAAAQDANQVELQRQRERN